MYKTKEKAAGSSSSTAMYLAQVAKTETDDISASSEHQLKEELFLFKNNYKASNHMKSVATFH